MLPELYNVRCPKNLSPRTTPVTVPIPGSKSITNRALLLATLADGPSLLENCLFSEDSRYFIECLKELGFEVTVVEATKQIKIVGTSGQPVKNKACIYVGSAGTAARFLTAYLGLCQGNYVLDSSEQMKKRPMDVLLNSLEQLGCTIHYTNQNGFFPFELNSNGFSQHHITIDINKSSQFLSALLISSVLCTEDFTIDTIGTHGLSYITMTIQMMKQFGVTVKATNNNHYVIPKKQHYQPCHYKIEPDLSAAAYFYAAGALLNIPIFIQGVTSSSLQGDLQFLTILQSMGCHILETSEGTTLFPSSKTLTGIDIDMSNCSDQAITLAAIAPFATTPTTIRGISHIRYQECNRIDAIITELSRMNIICEELEDGVKIYPGVPTPCAIETYEDHRMAMGFALIGLKIDGIQIKNPSCCKKTFENYFETLESFIQEILEFP